MSRTGPRALVTGGAGFLGRHFTLELLRRGYDVTAVDVASLTQLFHASVDAEVNVPLSARLDLREYLAAVKTDVRPDLVVHCAATGPHRRAIDTEPGNLAYNVALDAALFEWATRARPGRVIYVSSSAVYPVRLQTAVVDPRPLTEDDQRLHMLDSWADVGSPDGSYGWTKLIGERMAARTVECGVPVTIVRPFSGYGSDQSADFPFGAFVDRALRRADPFEVWGSADQVRDWIHVDDVVAGALRLAEVGELGPVNLCTGRRTSMRHLVELITTATSDSDYRPEVLVDEDAPLGVHHRVGDPERLLRHYVPAVSLETGIRRALAERPVGDPAKTVRGGDA